MADITMCVVKDCLNAGQCFRKTAKPNPYRQSYADFSNTCDKYKKDESIKEDLGIIKLDLLGIKDMSMVKDNLKNIDPSSHINDLSDILDPKEDKNKEEKEC